MEENLEVKPEMKKIILGIVIGTVVIAGIIYAGYSYSKKHGGKLTLPAGQNFLGKGGLNPSAPPTAPLRFTAASDVAWVSYKGKVYSYSFSYPKSLNLASFTNDPSDSVAINWGNINPQYNLLLNVEKVKDRGEQYLGKPEDFVRNWWKAFSGLKGVLSVDKFTNANGLKGYKAIFINQAGQSPNVDIFFEVPNDESLIIHLANGVLDPNIFNRIVDSLKYTP